MENVIYSVVQFIICFAAVFFYVTRLLPHHWSGVSRYRDMEAWSMLPYSREFKNGLKRHIPVLFMAIFSLMLASLSLMLEVLNISNEMVIGVLYFIAGIGLVVYFLLAYFVIYRNRPSFLVAPHYRDEESVVQVRYKKGTLLRRRLIAFFCWIAIFVGITVLFLSRN